MRNPEEYLDEVYFHKTIRNTLSQILSPDGIDDNMYERLLKAFSLIQKEVYNQAIEDAANNVTLLEEGIYTESQRYTIQSDSNYYSEVEIDVNKDSILKLKIK